MSGVILLYHRIGDPPCDPFDLAVAAEEFREQLEVLQSLGVVRPLADFGDNLTNEPSFAITFDDGYADNLHVAKPILEEAGAPATVFVTTGSVGGRPFWWDELAELLSANEGEGTIELDSRSWSLVEMGWERVFEEVWAALQLLDQKERKARLRALRAQLPVAPVSGGGSVTVEELVELDRGELITIGAHTRTHPMLSRLPRAKARNEIVGSKAWLEEVLGREVTTFSYPYGGPDHYGEDAVRIVENAGFELACSAVAGLVTPDSPLLELPRLPVERWDAEGLERALAQLIGEPPRRRSRVPAGGRVDFGDLRRLEPISTSYGFDRGGPIDRHYIERFLSARSEAIGGRVLEIAEPLYIELFGGGRVTHPEILDVRGGADATYTCRLEEADEIESDAFDCVVCTQTIQFIHDVGAALGTVHRILKPGGTLLLTAPGITGIGCGDDAASWHWSFTGASLRRLLARWFAEERVEIEVFGNVLAASSFLWGLGASELTAAELELFDPNFPLLVAACAVK